jgi:phenylalanyl-tRNA synthetase beta chain
LGTPAKEYLNIEEDFVFEIGLTPNRPDAASHLGVARDVVAVLNCRDETASEKFKLIFPSVDDFKQDDNSLPIPVIVEDAAACPRYSGITVSGIVVEESPAWLKNKLTAIGLRPINNIVDITNYVLFETGQPLHAFDADKIAGQKVIVKKLKEGQAFVTLDGVERKLSATDLMICNEQEGMCMAGVFGGEQSGVTETTKNIFLESAWFEATTIRKTSKRHNLKTDASFRFERGTDPEMTVYALKRAAMLFKEIASGKISSSIVDEYPKPVSRKKVEFSISRFSELAGVSIAKEKIISILKSLDFIIENDGGDVLLLAVPTNKVDVTRQADVTEEVLRIYSYNNIEIGASIKSSLSYNPKPDPEKVQDSIAEYLTANGFYEILTNSLTRAEYYEANAAAFAPEHCVKIYNPLSKDLSVMRQTLLFSGLEAIAYNQNRKQTDLKFYEFGKVYFYNAAQNNGALTPYSEKKQLVLFAVGQKLPESWDTTKSKTDAHFLKGMSDIIIKRLGFGGIQYITGTSTYIFSECVRTEMNGIAVCETGALSPALLKQFDIKNEVYYACIEWDSLLAKMAGISITATDIPKFPEVRRDLALLVDKAIRYSDIEQLAYKTEKKLLRKVNLFDIYEGDKLDANKKSYALSFILQDTEKTLTDDVIDAVMKKLQTAFMNDLKAQLR